MPRVLITGINGFAGRHLTALLRGRGFDIAGIVHAVRDPGLTHRVEPADTQLIPADVTDLEALTRAVDAVRPEGVFHLAGLAHVPASDADPVRAFRVNALGSVNLLAAVAACGVHCRVLLVSSASVYGLVEPSAMPVREQAPFRPLSPYGASKAAAELMACQWPDREVEVVCVRPFNHTGPGQVSGFVCPDFARQLISIERGRHPPTIAVGNLDVVRDFSDVRDVVTGYLAAWERGRPGAVYNICSGVGRSVREVLDAMIELSGLRVRVEVVPERVRLADVPALIGSADALRTETGWQPSIPWRETLAAVLDDWRQRETEGGRREAGGG